MQSVLGVYQFSIAVEQNIQNYKTVIIIVTFGHYGGGMRSARRFWLRVSQALVLRHWLRLGSFQRLPQLHI